MNYYIICPRCNKNWIYDNIIPGIPLNCDCGIIPECSFNGNINLVVAVSYNIGNYTIRWNLQNKSVIIKLFNSYKPIIQKHISFISYDENNEEKIKTIITFS